MFKNDWAHYSYDGIKNSYRISNRSLFDFSCSIKNTSISHKSVLNDLATEIYEKNNRLDILLSGGLNSQIIVKTYKELGIPVNVKIFSYENDINLHWDVAAALKFCQDQKIKYTKIDFNLKKFFELEAEHYFKKSLNTDVSKLPLLKMIEYCDNMPVLGTAYPLITRSNFFYDTPATWDLRILESEINILGYSQKINRPVISNWFLYDSNFLSSLINHSAMQDLIKDKNTGCTSNFEIRSKIYDLKINRVSQSGLEWESNNWLFPDFVNDFYHKVISSSIQSKMKVVKIKNFTDQVS